MKLPPTIVVWTIIFALLSTGCQENQQPRWYIPDSAAKANAVTGKGDLYGHYVCRDFIELAGARKSVRQVRTRPIFLEIVFKPEYGDSVLLITGYENFFALWKQRTNDWIEIKNVLPNRDVLLFTHEGYREISLTDTLKGREGGRQVHNWVFTKTVNEYPAKGGNKPTMIYGWVNKEMIVGNYTLPGNPENVIFEASGTITGWNAYNNYEICMGGSCFRLMDSPMDIITLSGNDSTDNYGLVIGPDSLHFYTLAGEKGGRDSSRQLKEKAWAMRRNNN
ncbi:MAG TPA: hypothetical protein VEC12_03885 [Bacteroidia bacterium]|nr:hypothetical protein [Bacteroidia bacterium]